MTENMHLIFNPHFSWPLLSAVAACALILCALGLRQNFVRSFCRLVVFAVLFFFLSSPQEIEEKKQALKNIVLIAIDQSGSQTLSGRDIRRDRAVNDLRQKLNGASNIEARFIDVARGRNDKTEVFSDIDKALTDIPENRRAGTILITDGQVWDKPANEILRYPLHVLLTGSKKEFDRKIVIDKSPAYALAGSEAEITFHIEDTGHGNHSDAQVSIFLPDGGRKNLRLKINEKATYKFRLSDSGTNEILISTAVLPGEMVTGNNQAKADVELVRNRLRVLLVSGEPYVGSRVWRDLLKSDPGIDLIHFTILRGPAQIDATPSSELSLIAFPFEELFERKLNQFDLVIMDRFGMNSALPAYYFENIKEYVQKGGALLVTNGPNYNSPLSLYYTSLGDILPAAPNGELVRKSFKPSLTESGTTHPVTSVITNNKETWGDWLEMMPVTAKKGETIMRGADNMPLLILSREGKGRVAQIASDQIWLWARGYQGGGPIVDLLKRTAHWLMKETELDERALAIDSTDAGVTLRKRNAGNGNAGTTLTGPDGKTIALAFKESNNGWLSADLNALPDGIYRIKDRDQIKIVKMGKPLTPEFSELVAEEGKLKPIAQKSGGNVIWLESNPDPDIKMMRASRRYGSANMIGLKDNNASQLLSSVAKDFPPTWAGLSLTLLSLIFLWWGEGRKRG